MVLQDDPVAAVLGEHEHLLGPDVAVLVLPSKHVQIACAEVAAAMYRGGGSMVWWGILSGSSNRMNRSGKEEGREAWAELVGSK